jgi:AbiV family abortive infection protein
MNPSEAGSFWKALMDNSSALISEAHVLLGARSYRRARSLTVLAQEELGKALDLPGIREGLQRRRRVTPAPWMH